MVNRRNLLSGGLLGTVGAALAADAAAAPQRQSDSNDDRLVAGAVDGVRAALERIAEVAPELARIREQQRIFLKTNHKFPDFIEVGIGVWEDVHDWHVRHQQPLNMTRTSDGRYVMSVMFTTLVLRSDQGDAYVGVPFDAR